MDQFQMEAKQWLWVEVLPTISKLQTMFFQLYDIFYDAKDFFYTFQHIYILESRTATQFEFLQNRRGILPDVFSGRNKMEMKHPDK